MIMGAFHAYDIRGIYNKDFNKDDAYKIGYFLVELLSTKKVLVGRDARVSSDEIFEYLAKGITDAGADVYDVGLATTPMVYYSTAKYEFNASVQITASHNSKEYNGMKVSRENALPVGYDTGLKQIEQRIKEGAPIVKSQTPGEIKKLDVRGEYLSFLRKYVADYSNLRIGIDCSNGMAALLIKELLGDAPVYIYDELDGTFPNHEANPLVPENVVDLQNLVKSEKCDIGVIFDGDADRVMFVDGQGHFVRPDLLIAVLAKYYLAREPGAGILCDIRTSRGVTAAISRLGGVTHLWKVGHAFAKVRLRELNAVVGGELAGHYYFREFHSCDAAVLCAQIVLGVVAAAKKRGQSFARLLSEIDIYANSGECNYTVERKAEAMTALRQWAYRDTPPALELDFDGYRFEWPGWWFNVRPSNTEPYLRLIWEAKDAATLADRRAATEAILAPFLV